MMNIFKRIYRWILISIILQVLVLLLINNVVIVKLNASASNAKITDFNDKRTSRKTISVELPENEGNIKVSYDGSYVSYIVNGKIEVMNVKKKQVINVIGKDNTELTYYNWLSDKNMIIYAYKTNNYTRVGVTTYDVDNEIEHDYQPITNIASLPVGSEVVDIQLSSKTNVTYVKVKTSDTQSIIFRYEIHGYVSYIMTTDVNTDIRIVNLVDCLAYKDPTSNKVYFRQGVNSSVHTLSFDRNIKLLRGDSEYSMYVGEYNAEGNIAKLYAGLYDEKSIDAWYQIELMVHVPEEHVLIAGTNAYIYVENENALYDINTSNKTSLNGKLLHITELYAVTLDGEKVRIIPLK